MSSIRFIVVLFFISRSSQGADAQGTSSYDEIGDEYEMCPSPKFPLMTFGKKTFYFEPYLEYDWYKTMAYCNHRGMQLVTFDSLKELQFITNYLNTTLGKRPGRFWIAINTSFGSSLRWVSTGSPVRRSLIRHPGSNLCGLIDGNKNYTISSAGCLRDSHFICESVRRKTCNYFKTLF